MWIAVGSGALLVLVGLTDIEHRGRPLAMAASRGGRCPLLGCGTWRRSAARGKLAIDSRTPLGAFRWPNRTGDSRHYPGKPRSAGEQQPASRRAAARPGTRRSPRTLAAGPPAGRHPLDEAGLRRRRRDLVTIRSPHAVYAASPSTSRRRSAAGQRRTRRRRAEGGPALVDPHRNVSPRSSGADERHPVVGRLGGHRRAGPRGPAKVEVDDPDPRRRSRKTTFSRQRVRCGRRSDPPHPTGRLEAPTARPAARRNDAEASWKPADELREPTRGCRRDHDPRRVNGISGTSPWTKSRTSRPWSS